MYYYLGDKIPQFIFAILIFNKKYISIFCNKSFNKRDFRE